MGDGSEQSAEEKRNKVALEKKVRASILSSLALEDRIRARARSMKVRDKAQKRRALARMRRGLENRSGQRARDWFSGNNDLLSSGSICDSNASDVSERASRTRHRDSDVRLKNADLSRTLLRCEHPSLFRTILRPQPPATRPTRSCQLPAFRRVIAEEDRELMAVGRCLEMGTDCFRGVFF
jgi:hypothetical protein